MISRTVSIKGVAKPAHRMFFGTAIPVMLEGGDANALISTAVDAGFNAIGRRERAHLHRRGRGLQRHRHGARIRAGRGIGRALAEGGTRQPRQDRPSHEVLRHVRRPDPEDRDGRAYPQGDRRVAEDPRHGPRGRVPAAPRRPDASGRGVHRNAGGAAQGGQVPRLRRQQLAARTSRRGERLRGGARLSRHDALVAALRSRRAGARSVGRGLRDRDRRGDGVRARVVPRDADAAARVFVARARVLLGGVQVVRHRRREDSSRGRSSRPTSKARRRCWTKSPSAAISATPT